MRFDKPPETVDQQIYRLEQRGMLVADKVAASHHLKHLNYYRLSGYWLPFEANHKNHEFKPGTSFEAVINLYVFDRELRLLLLDAIERVEVSLRCHWAHQLALAHGAHAYLDASLANSRIKHIDQVAKLAKSVKNSREGFVKHLQSKYTNPGMPPIWAISELMTLGELSHWYSMLRPISLRAKIANAYDFDQQVLESALKNLTYLRNLCAHHSRVWNRELVITMERPRSKPRLLSQSIDSNQDRHIYLSVATLAYLLDIACPDHSWKKRLFGLIDAHQVNATAMGFPADWLDRPLWKGADS